MLSRQTKDLKKLKDIIISNKQFLKYCNEHGTTYIKDVDKDEIMGAFSASDKTFIKNFFKKSQASEICVNDHKRVDIVFNEDNENKKMCLSFYYGTNDIKESLPQGYSNFIDLGKNWCFYCIY